MATATRGGRCTAILQASAHLPCAGRTAGSTKLKPLYTFKIVNTNGNDRVLLKCRGDVRFSDLEDPLIVLGLEGVISRVPRARELFAAACLVLMCADSVALAAAALAAFGQLAMVELHDGTCAAYVAAAPQRLWGTMSTKPDVVKAAAAQVLSWCHANSSPVSLCACALGDGGPLPHSAAA